VAGEQARPPTALFWNESPAAAASSLSSLRSAMEGLDLTMMSADADTPRALFAWNHGYKPNYMVHSSSHDRDNPEIQLHWWS